MPVNKHIGKLWFETQEEIDEYDDLMVSNIEFKKDDFNSDHFAILSVRDTREIVPQLTDKAKKQINDYYNYLATAKPKKLSYTGFWELPFLKYSMGLGAGYLLIRELPIRSFYARSFIFAIYLIQMRDIVWPSFIRGSIVQRFSFNYNSEYQSANKQAL